LAQAKRKLGRKMGAKPAATKQPWRMLPWPMKK